MDTKIDDGGNLKDQNEDNRLKWSIIRFVIAVFVATLLIGAIVVKEGKFANELRDGLVTNCEKNGNPLREAVQGLYLKEIEQAKNKQQIQKFFPQIPPDELEKLLTKQIEEAEEKIEEVKPISCEKQYP